MVVFFIIVRFLLYVLGEFWKFIGLFVCLMMKCGEEWGLKRLVYKYDVGDGSGYVLCMVLNWNLYVVLIFV